MSKIIDTITKKAEALYDIRREIERIEEENREKLAAKKLERDALQEALLDSLRKHKLSSIKVANGDSFTRARRKMYEVTLLPHALAWATKNKCVSIDKRLVSQKLGKMDEIPAGFEMVESEYISVRKGKQE